jgi:predicted amidohydrolase
MKDLTISLIQMDIAWEDKKTNLTKLEEKLSALSGKTHIAILPEMFTTGFSMNATSLAEPMNGPTLEWMKEISARYKIILTGSIIISENNQFYNRLIWMQPNGIFFHYDKRHLFGYAGEDLQYAPGTKRLIVSVNGWKIQLLICYDLRFPVWSRQQIQSDNPEFDAIIYVANWPSVRSHAWKSLLMARAIENQCYAIGVNRVGLDGKGHAYQGDSMVINQLGEIHCHAIDEECIETVTLSHKELNAVREQYPFWKDADSFVITD